MNQQRISVLGAGSWGTALAMLLAKNQHKAVLWGRSQEKILRMKQQSCNPFFLPDIPFPKNLSLSAELEACLANHEIILLAVPSHAFRENLKAIKPYVNRNSRICWATKGLETSSHKLMHQLIEEEFPDIDDMAVLSGPTFAHEVASELPTAITIAANNQSFAHHLGNTFHNHYFRPYLSDDMIGVEIGGTVKNVLAIAAGIADGLGYGANTRSALITRGIAEMSRLAVKLGGKPSTLMGLSGMGDLILTCTDNQSRNRRLGLALGKGESVEQAKKAIGQVVEGILSAAEVRQIAQKNDVNMPIVEQVYQVLYGHSSPENAVSALLDRTFSYEH